MRHRVVVLALDGLLPFELGIPQRIFGRARSADPGDPDPNLYEVVTCSVRPPGPVTTDADFTIMVPLGPEALATADTVVIPASYELGPVHDEGRLTDELAVAFAYIRPDTRLVSICTGSYVLAAAGRLDGRPATTHWSSADHFQQLFPRVRVDPDVLFIDDGDILTSAGTGAAIDLCLHVVRLDHGAAVANEVARRMVVPPHREGGQAQFAALGVARSTGSSLSGVLDWARTHLDRPLTVADLAREAHMSPRTFARHFTDELGVSPLQWLVQQRVRFAQELLETTDEPVERIARLTGFGAAANLRQHFGRVTSVSPQTYRHVFQRGAAL
jgi:transcriptional regulator GlxA family with amidase domain